MLESFRNPPLEHRVDPLWLWNCILDESAAGSSVASGLESSLIDQYVERHFSRYRHVSPDSGLKLASSAAHANGIRDVVYDPFAHPGQGLHMEHIKRTIDRQFMLGATRLAPNAPHPNVPDARSFALYQAAYAPYYRILAEYTSRLNYVLSQGRHKAQVALLCPTKGFQLRHGDGSDAEAAIAEYCFTLAVQLQRDHIDYDVISEECVEQATVYDQRLLVADQDYELLVMPPTVTLRHETALKINEFVEDGGKVLAAVLLPAEDAAGHKDAEVRNVFFDLFGTDPAVLRDNVIDGFQLGDVSLWTTDDNAFLLEVPDPESMARFLRQSVRRAIRPDVSVTCGGTECRDITNAHRVIPGADTFFFANGAFEPREVEITIRCGRAPHMLDPETGHRFALPDYTQVASRTIVRHRFERCGSLLICFTDEPALGISGRRAAAQARPVEISPVWEFHTEQPNVLPVRQWSHDAQADGESVRHEYTAQFRCDVVPEDLHLVLEHTPETGGAVSSFGVMVNGAPVVAHRPLAKDRGFLSTDIHALAEPGVNDIRVVIEHPSGGDEPAMPVLSALTGTFSLDESGTAIIEPRRSLPRGSWTDHGYPFYSGTGVYAQTVAVPAFGKRQRVVLAVDDPADMVELVVNGASAALRAWAPYEADITRLVKPGPNRIEIRVTNTPANALLSDPRQSGLTHGARLIIC